MTERFDVVIVGGGHNGLTAAAYLAQAGKSVLLLERLAYVGGAAVSAQAFEGLDARLSRYSYLVSLLPKRIITDLGLRVQLSRRRYSSYTPDPGSDLGLLVDNGSPSSTRESFDALGASADAEAWESFYESTGNLARTLFPTVTEPLLTRSEARRAVNDASAWDAFIERPVGEVIQNTFANDVVRGVVLTDALIGTFAPNVDETLAGNRCFLYHVIGGGTGDWDVPVGGMGAVSGELYNAARAAGAVIRTSAEVTAIDPDGLVTYVSADSSCEVAGDFVLANVAPWVLASLMSVVEPAETSEKPEGAQVKVNLLLSRLPRLRDSSVDPAAAFGGTFHINETWSQLSSAYDAASGGGVPDPLPCEIYCHSLTDPTILSPELRASGAQTLTVFGLHAPHRLIDPDENDARRDELEGAVLASLNSVLAEPIEPLLLRDASGNPTIETKTTLDLEAALHLPGGNIFHGPLAWPFAEDDAPLATPAQRWGVATVHSRILLCGAGAQRGGGVSGIGGHNAAMAVLEASGA
ncbi:NAD(P)/FAD-dependent oxidoreductase [Glaciihabitans arcticus]|uniref:NAD(P)/FAD-dependent oxidoreductase n=1 Tax=Glaciihabitans arcticus TaxID=2668039 RepID=A0A4V2JF62_9MICO|nr:NAD(P)/FAD-dependent oxidoreductase [Glaciihabitans arcticus]TBN58219.1 NAD(P)/FAD-dependent oxidoreductase [Glaciihabitans arcticus]